MHTEIMQPPPRYSAVKVDEQRAYRRARSEDKSELAAIHGDEPITILRKIDHATTLVRVV